MTGSVSCDPVEAVTRLQVGLSVGGGAVVCCHRYPDRAPILSMACGPVAVSVAVPRTAVGAAALAFARDLAAAAVVFLAECERFAAPAADTAEPADAA